MDFKLNRRDVLKRSAGLGAALILPTNATSLAFSPEMDSPADLLICVFMRGAVDGLSMVTPQFDSNYFDLRKKLAIQAGGEKGAIDLDGRFAFHPALKPLIEAFQDERLAVIHAVGSHDPSHSHFDAMEYMERATPGIKTTSSCWIGRHLLSASWQNNSAFRAVGMGGAVQSSLRSSVPATALMSIKDFQLMGEPEIISPFQQNLAALYALSPQLGSPAAAAFAAMQKIEAVRAGGFELPADILYPDTEFGNGLKDIVQLANAQIGLEAACVDLGGFDTHANQENTLNRLFPELAGGLAAFDQHMRVLGRAYSMVVMTEFGRRVEENASNGTDHGHGSVMLAMGDAVQGGQVITKWPGLAPDQLYGPGDLAVTIDFRDVLAELISKRLMNGENLTSILPDHEPVMQGVFS